ncbi:MAG: hypothetical protein ACYC8S_03045 [Minisyncoccota bacterium]
MDEIFKLYETTGALHHAYLIEGDANSVRTPIFENLRTYGLPHEGHPDFWTEEFETFGIEESRGLREMQTGKAVAGEQRVFVIFTTLITTEAQNALLKTFEDPAPGVHFFLVVPSAYALLPTLRSRLMHVGRGARGEGLEYKKDATDFLDATLSERLARAKKIADKKDRAYAIALADAIVEVVYERFLDGGGEKEHITRVLGSAQQTREYLNDRAPSVKMLFEYLALTIER